MDFGGCVERNDLAQMMSSSEHSNEPSGFMGCGEFLDYLKNK